MLPPGREVRAEAWRAAERGLRVVKRVWAADGAVARVGEGGILVVGVR